MSSGTGKDQWYALHVRPRSEKVVVSHLRTKGYDEYLPLYTLSSRWSDRTKVIEKPLFAGYAFCKFDVQKKLPILELPEVLNIVGIGKVFIPISEAELASIRQIVASGLHCEPWPFIEAGQTVSVTRGPLTGIEGTVIKVKSHLRLVVSLPMFQRSVAVEIDRDSVEPIARSKRRA